MHEIPRLLVDLAMVLGVAAVTTVLCRSLKVPVVMGYLLAGLVVGPHVPIPLAADSGNVKTLSELGVILLMFSIGLEFNREKLRRSGPTALMVGLIQVGFVGWLGYLAARAFGLGGLESVFAGAALSISSTMIISRLMTDRGEKGPLRELVFAVLVVEDLLAMLMLAILSTVAAVGTLTGGQLLRTLGGLGLFLAILAGGGLLVVPRLIRWIAARGQDETLLVASVGLCFICAVAAARFHYSVALGAFVAGVLVAESGQAPRVEHLVAPLRDLFAAIFFVSIGMLIEPGALLKPWPMILAFSGVVIAGKLSATAVASALAGQPPRRSLEAGLAMTQIGEFSFILVGAGLDLKAVSPVLLPVVVAVTVLTSLATPFLVDQGDPMARWVDRVLPQGAQGLLRHVRGRMGLQLPRPELRRPVRILAGEAVLLALLLVAASRLPGETAWAAAASGVAAVLLGLHLFKLTRTLSRAMAVPRPQENPIVQRLRRRVLHLVLLGCLALPALLIVQPFVAPLPAATLVATLAAAAAAVLWRDLRALRA